MIRLCTGLIAIVALVSLAVAADDAEKKELASLQGKWKAVSVKMGNNKVPEEMLKQMDCTIEGNKMGAGTGDKGLPIEIKLQPGKKPKEIDFVHANEDETKILLGIYKIEGDKLTMSMAIINQPRPKNFNGSEMEVVTEYKRVKPAK